VLPREAPQGRLPVHAQAGGPPLLSQAPARRRAAVRLRQERLRVPLLLLPRSAGRMAGAVRVQAQAQRPRPQDPAVRQGPRQRQQVCLRRVHRLLGLQLRARLGGPRDRVRALRASDRRPRPGAGVGCGWRAAGGERHCPAAAGQVGGAGPLPGKCVGGGEGGGAAGRGGGEEAGR
jgi:hypothetical protein